MVAQQAQEWAAERLTLAAIYSTIVKQGAFDEQHEQCTARSVANCSLQRRVRLESGPVQKILNLVAQRASEIVQNLLKVTESQFKQMSKPLARTAPIFIAWFANFSRSISMI